MTDTPTSTSPSARLHWIQVKLAFGNEGKVQARPATLVELDEAHVDIRYIGGSEETVQVVEPEAGNSGIQQDLRAVSSRVPGSVTEPELQARGIG